MARWLCLGAIVATLLTPDGFQAPTSVPEIAFDASADFLKLPSDTHLGEVAGVATNSRGQLFVYTRTGNPTVGLGNSR